MSAQETANLVARYVPRPVETPDQRDLLLLEQKRWAPYCGLLTRINFFRYLHDYFYGEAGTEDDDSYTTCCASADLAIEIRAYPLAPGVRYQLRATAGEFDEPRLETVVERETVTFSLAREASINHPAAAIRAARWLTGPWTTGGAAVAAPALSVSGRTVRAPIPLFGSVELALEVQRWTHMLRILKQDAGDLLIRGWAEYVVGLPAGGRPVALELEAPPGGRELALTGAPCGRGGNGGGGGSFHVDWPDPNDEPPKASPRDNHVRCKYCELDCDEGDV